MAEVIKISELTESTNFADLYTIGTESNVTSRKVSLANLLKVIDSIEYTPSDEDEGNNVLTINLKDGTSVTGNIKNGSKGSTPTWADFSEADKLAIAAASAALVELPVVNDAVLTIRRNSELLAEFSANSDTNKAVNIRVPETVAELSDASLYAKRTELANFITKDVNYLTYYYLKSETYTRNEINSMINAIQQFTYETVAALPTPSASTMHKIYLVPSTEPVTANVKDEFITVQDGVEYKWEQIGTTTVDLSDYITTSELNDALSSYVTLTAFGNAIIEKQDKGNLVTSLSAASSDVEYPSAKCVYDEVKDAAFIEEDGQSSLNPLELENTANKVTSLSASSTDTQYPSAKAVYDRTTVTEILWADLKTLKDNGNLQAGKSYRITDYVATTTQSDSQSANHPFDIIVQALSSDTLSEDAKAALHSGDSYFASQDLGAWTLKYTIDNDTSRFTWADSTNGKGVVYRMIDENGNDLPYDFKGIQFKRYEVASTTDSYMSALVGLPIAHPAQSGITLSSDYKWYYTFSWLGSTWDADVTDASLNALASNVVFASGNYADPNNNLPVLFDNVFAYGKVLYDFLAAQRGETGTYTPQSFATHLRFNGADCKRNSFFAFCGVLNMQDTCRDNLIVGQLRHSEINTNFQDNLVFVTNDCSHFYIGQDCSDNSIHGNTIGDSFIGNSFRNNKINSNIYSSTFGNSFGNNTIDADTIQHSSFSNYFQRNTLTSAYFVSVQVDGGQFTDCTFSGKFTACTFHAICGYVDFVGGTSGNTFVGVDVVGNIRGSSGSHISIDNAAFIAANASGVKRRIRIEGDVDGNIVASWRDDGLLVGIMSADGGTTWTSIAATELVSNKVTTIDSNSTDTEYPSAKCVYDEVSQLGQEVDGKQDALTFDNTPTSASTNPVTSGGVYTALADKQDTSNLVTSINASSTDTTYPSAKCVYDATVDAVKYTAQTLTTAQQTQARTNIDAVSTDELSAATGDSYVVVASLPTASASTLNKIYLVGPDANGEYDRYVTAYDGANYTWTSLGSTAIDLSDYVTKADVGGEMEIGLSDLTAYSGVLSSGKWDAVSSSSYKHIFLPVTPKEVYKITAGSYTATFAALTQQDLSPSAGDTPSFCAACYQINVSAGGSVTFTVPDDCYYIYITTLYGGTDRSPSVSILYPYLSDTARSAELGTTTRYYTGCLKISSGVIDGSGNWDAVTAVSYTHLFIPMTPGETVKLVNSLAYESIYAPMTQIDASPSQGDAASICSGYERIKLAAGNSVEFTAPDGCYYLYMLKKNNGVDREALLYRQEDGSIDEQLEGIAADITDVANDVTILQNYALNSFVVGDGDSFASTSIYGLKPGSTYRLILQNADWDKSGITATAVYQFQIANLYNGTAEVLAYVFIDGDGNFGTVDDYYDFTVPDDTDYIRVGLRATTDAVVNFMIIASPTLDEINSSWNSQLHAGLADWATPCARFSALMAGDEINNIAAVDSCDSFLFFTDPHTQHINPTWYKHFEDYMGQIQKVYNSTPTEFALCGGDWLGDSDTPDEAAYKLGLIGKTCYTMLPNCYLLVGNHDTNYQGKKDADSATYTTQLPNIAIRNLWYYWNANKAYYYFDSRNTRFYCFDTGIEGQALTAQDSYGYEQAHWFANALLTETTEHIAIALHIYYVTLGGTIQPLTALLMQIATAYNSRGSITIESTVYDFTHGAGTVEFVIAGHKHADFDCTYTGDGVSIPVIMTKDTGNGTSFPTVATFDLVFVDYDNRKITCIRVGSGSDREISLS